MKDRSTERSTLNRLQKHFENVTMLDEVAYNFEFKNTRYRLLINPTLQAKREQKKYLLFYKKETECFAQLTQLINFIKPKEVKTKDTFILTELKAFAYELLSDKKLSEYEFICFNLIQAETLTEKMKNYKGWIADWYYDLKEKVYKVECKKGDVAC